MECHLVNFHIVTYQRSSATSGVIVSRAFGVAPAAEAQRISRRSSAHRSIYELLYQEGGGSGLTVPVTL